MDGFQHQARPSQADTPTAPNLHSMGPGALGGGKGDGTCVTVFTGTVRSPGNLMLQAPCTRGKGALLRLVWAALVTLPGLSCSG